MHSALSLGVSGAFVQSLTSTAPIENWELPISTVIFPTFLFVPFVLFVAIRSGFIGPGFSSDGRNELRPYDENSAPINPERIATRSTNGTNREVGHITVEMGHSHFLSAQRALTNAQMPH